MLANLFKKINQRISFNYIQFIDEAFFYWKKKNEEFLRRIAEIRGGDLPNLNYYGEFENITKFHKERIKRHWEFDAKNKSEQDLLGLVAEYPSVLNHWKKLQKGMRKDDQDWREYAKAGRFYDTPDDLLDKLIDTEPRKLSHLAIEHTARRIGLKNLKSTKSTKKIQNDNATGYSPQYLLDLKTKGEKLKEKIRSDKKKGHA